jgi:hypothetical protein
MRVVGRLVLLSRSICRSLLTLVHTSGVPIAPLAARSPPLSSRSTCSRALVQRSIAALDSSLSLTHMPGPRRSVYERIPAEDIKLLSQQLPQVYLKRMLDLIAAQVCMCTCVCVCARRSLPSWSACVFACVRARARRRKRGVLCSLGAHS